MLTNVVLVAAGGALGSVGRYLLTLAATHLIGGCYPWGTFAVNIAGAFAMGLVVMWVARSSSGGPEMRLFLATGLLGGFTTFSAFSLDLLTLIEAQDLPAAASYAVGSVLVSLLAVTAGVALGRLLWA